MNPQSDNDLPLYEPEEQTTYTLDIVAQLTGVSSQTILHYQEQGLIRKTDLDDETVHTLRRIEHLRQTCEANLSGLKLILDLMDEVDRLKSALRVRR
ncbi:MAG: chaperone modulator CbpM [Luteolibacter sp.]|uniref:chaperone modulator CbpM n=1 Tax=Luteolibacter sp. TaxID=1962973 RepID=UPI003264D24B